MVIYAVCYTSLTYLPLWSGAVAVAWGLPVSRVGLIGSLELASVAFVSIVAALRLLHPLRRSYVIALLAAHAVINLAAAQTQSLTAFISARVAVGLCSGLLLADINLRAATWRDPTRIFAGQIFCMVLSAVLFFPLAPTVMGALGATAAFDVAAGWALGAIILCGWLTPHGAAPVNAHDRASSVTTASPVVLAAAIVAPALLIVANGSIWTYMIPAAARVGIGVESLSRLIAVSAVLNLAAPLAAGYVSQSWLRPLRSSTGGLALFALAAYAIAVSESPTLFVIGALTMTFFVMFVVPFLLRQIVECDPSGRASAMNGGAMMIGAASGPAIGGIVIENCGFGYLGAISLAMTAATLGCSYFVSVRRGGDGLQQQSS